MEVGSCACTGDLNSNPAAVHMPKEKEKKEKRKKRDKSEKSTKRSRDHGSGRSEEYASASWGSTFQHLLGIRCCSEVSWCSNRDSIDAKGRHHGKKESRKGRSRSSTQTSLLEAPSHYNDHDCMNGNDDDGDMSARSGMSYASESQYSVASTYSRAESSRGRSSRREHSDARYNEGSRRNRDDHDRRTPSAGGSRDTGDAVRVLNLADLQGQKLPVNGIGGLDDQSGNMSARSGRSCRSETRSEGGQSACSGRSVASISVKKYMGYLSEPLSSGEVKKKVKDFVRQMVKGREMSVLRADGALKPVLCALTRSLDVFKIKSGDQVRKLPLTEVERSIHGAPEELSDLETPLDETCATLELATAECISFKFAERRAAELFTLCLQLFIDGQKQ